MFRAMVAALTLLVAQPGAPPALAADVASDITSTELLSRIREGNAPVVIDVRTEEEYRSGHVPGAMSVPLREIVGRADELTPHRDDEVVLYCELGPRASFVYQGLRALGFRKLRILTGHMRAWREGDLPTEP